MALAQAELSPQPEAQDQRLVPSIHDFETADINKFHDLLGYFQQGRGEGKPAYLTLLDPRRPEQGLTINDELTLGERQTAEAVFEAANQANERLKQELAGDGRLHVPAQDPSLETKLFDQDEPDAVTSPVHKIVVGDPTTAESSGEHIVAKKSDVSAILEADPDEDAKWAKLQAQSLEQPRESKIAPLNVDNSGPVQITAEHPSGENIVISPEGQEVVNEAEAVLNPNALSEPAPKPLEQELEIKKSEPKAPASMMSAKEHFSQAAKRDGVDLPPTAREEAQRLAELAKEDPDEADRQAVMVRINNPKTETNLAKSMDHSISEFAEASSLDEVDKLAGYWVHKGLLKRDGATYSIVDKGLDLGQYETSKSVYEKLEEAELRLLSPKSEVKVAVTAAESHSPRPELQAAPKAELVKAEAKPQPESKSMDLNRRVAVGEIKAARSAIEQAQPPAAEDRASRSAVAGDIIKQQPTAPQVPVSGVRINAPRAGALVDGLSRPADSQLPISAEEKIETAGASARPIDAPLDAPRPATPARKRSSFLDRLLGR